MTLVREVMTPTLAVVEPEASLVEVARAMRDNDVGDVLVVSRERLVGLVTDRDLVVRGLARLDSPTAAAMPDGTPPNAAAVCTRELAIVGPDQDTREAGELMQHAAVRRLPVVERGTVVGIVSLGDLAAADESGSPLAGISDAPPNH